MSLILILILAPVLLAGALIGLRRITAGSRLVALGAIALFVLLVPLVASRIGSGGEGTQSGAATVASESSTQTAETTTAPTEGKTSGAETGAEATESEYQAAEQASELSPMTTRSS